METNPYAPPTASLDPLDAAAAGTPERVGFWPRLGAALIDTVVIWVVGALIGGLVAAHVPAYIDEVLSRSQAKMTAQQAAQAAALLGFMRTFARWAVGATAVTVVYGLLEGFFGRALGKLLLGLRIGGPDGRRASTGRLLGRMLVKQSASFLGVPAMLMASYTMNRIAQIAGWVIVLGFLLVLLKRKQALHDLVAGTAVYHNSDLVLR